MNVDRFNTNKDLYELQASGNKQYSQELQAEHLLVEMIFVRQHSNPVKS